MPAISKSTSSAACLRLCETRAVKLAQHGIRGDRTGVERERLAHRTEQRLDSAPGHRVVEQVLRRLRKIARSCVVLQEFRHDKASREHVRQSDPRHEQPAAHDARRERAHAVEDDVRTARERGLQCRGAGRDERDIGRAERIAGMAVEDRQRQPLVPAAVLRFHECVPRGP
jgi:hypothetical protein